MSIPSHVCNDIELAIDHVDLGFDMCRNYTLLYAASTKTETNFCLKKKRKAFLFIVSSPCLIAVAIFTTLQGCPAQTSLNLL